MYSSGLPISTMIILFLNHERLEYVNNTGCMFHFPERELYSEHCSVKLMPKKM